MLILFGHEKCFILLEPTLISLRRHGYTTLIQCTRCNLSSDMRKPVLTYAKTNPQISFAYCAAEHRLYFRCIDSTIPLLAKSEISSLYLSSVIYNTQSGLYRTWSEIPKTGFLMTRFIYKLLALMLVVRVKVGYVSSPSHHWWVSMLFH